MSTSKIEYRTISEEEISDVEKKLRCMADELPEAKMALPVSKVMNARKKKYTPWKMVGRAAAFVILFLAGNATAFAASSSFREMIIHFFTSNVTEETPLEQLSNAGSADVGNEDFTPITVGMVTFLQNQKLDEHFTASYVSSPDYMDILYTPSENLLFYSQDGETGQCTYYRIVNGSLESISPEICKANGSVRIQSLSGVLDYTGNTDYNDILLPEMTFTVEWQQYGDEIIISNENSQKLDIGSTFGGTKNGEFIEGEYDGMFMAFAFPEDSEWVQVCFLLDAQLTDYQYPFLFNIKTGETRDPLAGIDLSDYACITELKISDDKNTATAMAGEDHEHLQKITIDLQTGKIEETPVLSAPVTDCYLSFATSDHTVFYTVGTQEQMSGYLYDTDKKKTTELFADMAWGNTWEDGLYEEIVELIGGNYAVHYKKIENEVYLLNLADGSEMFLEGIPANQDVDFFWNNEKTVLSISQKSEAGQITKVAFYVPELNDAWYFDRTENKNIKEVMSCWYGEYGYLIQGASPERDEWYLSLYEYTP